MTFSGCLNFYNQETYLVLMILQKEIFSYFSLCFDDQKKSTCWFVHHSSRNEIRMKFYAAQASSECIWQIYFQSFDRHWLEKKKIPKMTNLRSVCWLDLRTEIISCSPTSFYTLFRKFALPLIGISSFRLHLRWILNANTFYDFCGSLSAET